MLRRADGTSHVVVNADSVTDVGWDRENVVLSVLDGPPVALPLHAWMPADRSDVALLPAAMRLERFGFRRLLESLGRDDAWTFDSSTTRRPPQPRMIAPSTEASLVSAPERILRLGNYAIIVYTGTFILQGLAVMIAGPRGRWLLESWGWLALFVSLSMFVLGATSVLLGRRRTLAAVSDAVDEVAGTRPPVRLLTGREGQLVLITAKGDEVRLPGPTEEGVAVAVALIQSEVSHSRGTVRSLYAVRLHVQDRSGQLDPWWLAEIPAAWLVDAVAGVEALRSWLTRAGVTWQEISVPRGAPRPSSASQLTRLVTDRLWSSPLAGWTVQYALGTVIPGGLLALVFTRWLLLVPTAVLLVRVLMALLRLRDKRRWGRGS